MRTDAAGTFRFDGVAPGKARVWAEAWPRIQAIAEPEVPAFAATDVALTMQPGAMVVGTVKDADGQPVRTMVFSTPKLPAQGHYSQCETREDGSFQLYYQPAERFFVCVGMHDSVTASRECVRSDDGLVRCDFVLAARAMLRGSVLGPDGRGLPGWDVVARNDRGHSAFCRTDRSGAFAIGVPAAEACVLAASSRDADEATVTVTVAAGERRCDLHVPVAAIPTAAVRGRLIGMGGAAVAGGAVQLVRQGGEDRSATTDSDGVFAFAGLPAAAWTLQIDGVHAATTTTTAGQQLDLGNIVDPRSASVDVVFEHADGSPWRGNLPRVRVSTVAGEACPARPEPLAGGIRLRLVPGSYRIAVQDIDVIAAPQTVTLAAAEQKSVRCAVAIGRTRTLACNGDGRDKPPGDCVLHLIVRARDGSIAVQRDLIVPQWSLRGFHYWAHDHTFALGSYTAEAWTDQGHRYRTTFVVSDDLDEPTRVDLPWVAN